MPAHAAPVLSWKLVTVSLVLLCGLLANQMQISFMLLSQIHQIIQITQEMKMLGNITQSVNRFLKMSKKKRCLHSFGFFSGVSQTTTCQWQKLLSEWKQLRCVAAEPVLHNTVATLWQRWSISPERVRMAQWVTLSCSFPLSALHFSTALWKILSNHFLKCNCAPSLWQLPKLCFCVKAI